MPPPVRIASPQDAPGYCSRSIAGNRHQRRSILGRRASAPPDIERPKYARRPLLQENAAPLRLLAASTPFFIGLQILHNLPGAFFIEPQKPQILPGAFFYRTGKNGKFSGLQAKKNAASLH